MELGILRLPESFTINNDNRFIVQIATDLNEGVTEQLLFSNIKFGYDNVTFNYSISSHSTEIEYVSSQVGMLSGEIDYVLNNFKSFSEQYIANAFKDLNYNLNPIGTIRCTSTPTSPSVYIPNTFWELVGQGNFIAGVGNIRSNGGLYSNGDKNGKPVTFNQGNSATNTTDGNFDLGEYVHPLSTLEMPVHNHEANMYGETNASIAGLYAESAGSPEKTSPPNLPNEIIAPVLSDPTGGNDPHNNLPPLYGLYFWRRVGPPAVVENISDTGSLTPIPTPTPPSLYGLTIEINPTAVPAAGNVSDVSNGSIIWTVNQTYYYPAGTTVTFQSERISGWIIPTVAWGGADAGDLIYGTFGIDMYGDGTANQNSILMNGNKSIIANYQR